MADVAGETYDASGRLQVSINMLGMVLRRTGSKVTQTKISGNTNPSSMLVDISGCTYPVVAIKMDGYACALLGRYNGTTNQYASNAPVGTAYNYYIYDWSPALPDTAAMEKRYDGNGRCSFNSDFFTLQAVALLDSVRQTFSLPGKILATAQGKYGGHSIRMNAACYDKGGVAIDDGNLTQCKDIRYRNDGKLYGGGTSGNGSCGMYEVTFDDVQVSAGNYQQYTTDQVRGWEIPGSVFALDVTNIPIGPTWF